MGDGNVTIFRELNSQLAAFMVKHDRDKVLKKALQQMIEDELRVSRPERGYIGNNVKIINAKDITNTIIKGDCEISGAARLSECTVMSRACFLPTPSWRMVRPVRPSAVPSVPAIIRVPC